MNEIVEKIANEKMVEKLLLDHTDFNGNPYIDDLAQDIYITLLDTREQTLKKLYENNELEFYIKKIIKNNLYSKTSPFYYKYQKFRINSTDIDDIEI